MTRTLNKDAAQKIGEEVIVAGWLHCVNLVIAPEKWVVIDLTVDQVQKHSRERILIRVVDPN